MTNEEAKAYFIMRLKDKYKYAKGYTTQKEAFEKAIEALEKQVVIKQKIEWLKGFNQYESITINQVIDAFEDCEVEE